MDFDKLKNFSIKIRNYKCFGDEAQGFDSFKPVNVIIGKNNCGKSSLLEVIEISTILRLTKQDRESTNPNAKILNGDIREHHGGKRSEFIFTNKREILDSQLRALQ